MTDFKKPLLIVVTVTVLSILTCHDSYGKMYIDITSPTLRRTPIAIAEFKNLSESGTSSKELAEKLREVLVDDLEFSGLFDIIDRKAHFEDPERVGIKEGEFDFVDWSDIGSELLIKGGYKDNTTGDECKVGFLLEVRLFDVVKQKLIAGKRYCGNKDQLRMIVHRFSNRIIKALTGENGVFESKLVFVSASSNDNKEIYFSDYDGHNIRAVTKNGSINLSPQWSPNGKWLLYTSFKDGQPKLYLKNPFTGKEIKVSDFPIIGPRWSPSGLKIASTLSIHGNPELYIIDLKTKKLIRLTNHWRIDVSPTWSPDGKKIAFVSDRAGKPHIYVMDAEGTNLKRLTYEGKDNASPSWSPKGDKIVFSRSMNGRVDIWVMNPDGSQQTRITSGSGSNEDPFWAPNGRYIVFKSSRDGSPSIYIMMANGANQTRIADGSNPSWSP